MLGVDFVLCRYTHDVARYHVHRGDAAAAAAVSVGQSFRRPPEKKNCYKFQVQGYTEGKKEGRK